MKTEGKRNVHGKVQRFTHEKECRKKGKQAQA